MRPRVYMYVHAGLRTVDYSRHVLLKHVTIFETGHS